MMTSSGMYSTGDLARVPCAAAKKLNSMNAVEFVGPRMVKREPAKNGAMSAHMAEQMMP